MSSLTYAQAQSHTHENYFSATVALVKDKRIIRAERIKARMAELRMDQSDLAMSSGVHQSTISLVLTGKTQNSRHFPTFARSLAVNLSWLLGDTDTKIDMFDLDGGDIVEEDLPKLLQSAEFKAKMVTMNYRPEGDLEQNAKAHVSDDLVEIDEIDLRFGMGGTYLDQHVNAETRQFSRAWLKNFTNAQPEHLVWTIGDGDSMEPTIRSGEVILIDKSQNKPRMGDGIWAAAFGEIGIVKRLLPMPDGTVQIHSDNPLVRPQVATDGELHIIGRVIAVVRRL